MTITDQPLAQLAASDVPVRPSVAEVVEKLQAQGSARQIAEFLAQEQITGELNSGSSCPLANYLRRETHRNVIVTGARVLVTELKEVQRAEAREGFAVTVVISPMVVADTRGTPIHAFVRGFDEGDYPELLAEAAE
jgi:hypothetical protein